ncbi:hypothetical protein CRE_04302 [Caenorhabditis remanei]|uniref:Uncharacterized protein n=1 Tax=Caenorhabditis remanei TaxID=31234 RepID=E3NAT4_CAERE|nr:hypothetical protein CRE_04302 [Caenorhabditis remanei]
MTNSSNIVFRLRVDLESLREKASEEPKIREKMKAWDFILERITRKTDLVPALIKAGLNLEQKIVDFPDF